VQVSVEAAKLATTSRPPHPRCSPVQFSNKLTARSAGQLQSQSVNTALTTTAMPRSIKP